ncbi:hypothetical protein AVEN_4055-1 [Araneus ventricosus]|uniref:Tc1-like transposase DDE domain-containing protein n=1 Tax=Araneus ventricosus TaxID=182803 RepID=A0A4Y2MBU5_ARAVE|nr:hypothetical protein AVEN_4055-1 [Araneus ventricosus]
MIQQLMNEWFESNFVPEAHRHLSGNGLPADAKIVLILDNCTAHLSLEISVKNVDEAHFNLDGYVNGQNWRIWGTENPDFAIEKSLYPRRVTVWCVLSSRGIVGAIFFEQTVNSARYVEALRNQFIPEIQSEPHFESMWFMQDGATPHRTNEVFDLLEEHFNERIVAFGTQNRKIWALIGYPILLT